MHKTMKILTAKTRNNLLHYNIKHNNILIYYIYTLI